MNDEEWEKLTDYVYDNIIVNYQDVEFYEWMPVGYNSNKCKITLLDNYGGEQFMEDISNILNELDEQLPEEIIFSHEISEEVEKNHYGIEVSHTYQCDITLKEVI